MLAFKLEKIQYIASNWCYKRFINIVSVEIVSGNR